ncbi:MAG: hypothetical protein IPJ84_00870 [Bdellovibrionales bacterium]|nr:hypothetical protein [Bdellovibrionales bacterium]
MLIVLGHILTAVFVFQWAEGTTGPILNISSFFWVLVATIAIVDIGLIVFFLRHRRFVAVSITALCTLTPILGIYLAQVSKTRAFNDCVENAEKLRVQIIEYKKQSGSYPDIKDGVSFEVCGRRILNGSIIRYEQTHNDFELSFSDGYVRFSGTSTKEMTSDK